MMSNAKKMVRESGFFQWRIAAAIGVSENTLLRWLRFEPTKEQQLKIENAISQLKEGDTHEE